MFLNEKHHFSLLSQIGANNVPIYKALELYINFNYFTTKCEHSSTNLGYLHQEVTYRPGAAEGTRDLRAWQEQIHKSCFGEVVWSSSITQWLWSSSREHLQVQGESSFFPSVTQIVCPLEYMEQWRGVGERQKCDLFFHCLSSNLIPLSWGLHPKDCSHPLIFPCNEPAWSRGLHLFGASSCICEVRQDVMYNSNSFICLFIFLVVYTIFKTRINLCFK